MKVLSGCLKIDITGAFLDIIQFSNIASAASPTESWIRFLRTNVMVRASYVQVKLRPRFVTTSHKIIESDEDGFRFQS